VAKTKSLASVSNSKLPTMSEAELYAAKTAQISAMATALTKMAEMHYEQANYAEAQKAYERILSWRQGELGAHHIDLVDDLNNLAGVMCVQELFDQAEPMIRRAVDILEKAEQPEPLRLAENLTSLAGLQFRLGVFAQAEPLLAKSLNLREQEWGPDSTELADPLRDYAKLLKKLGKLEEAEQYYSRAKILLARRKAEAAEN
jgi:tetratricopeptide (TPR) repeat protein